MNPITKLEAWAAIALIVVFGNGCFYAFGRWQGEKAVYASQALADAAETHKILDRAIELRNSDDQGRTITDEFIHRVTVGMADVNTKFAKLPNVVLDSRGCSDFSDAFELRYNAVSDLLSGRPFDPAGVAPDPLPIGPVPPAR